MVAQRAHNETRKFEFEFRKVTQIGGVGCETLSAEIILRRYRVTGETKGKGSNVIRFRFLNKDDLRSSGVAFRNGS